MATIFLFLFKVAFFCTFTHTQVAEDIHTEELFIKRLHTGHVYTVSQFTTISQSFASKKGMRGIWREFHLILFYNLFNTTCSFVCLFLIWFVCDLILNEKNSQATLF